MTRLPGRIRPLRGDSGATAVEFALILLPLVLLLVGVVDFGRALYTRNNMIEAADMGARMILIDNAASDAAIASEIRDGFIAGPDAGLSIAFGTATESGVQFRTIELSYGFDLLVPLLATDRLTFSHSRRVPLE